jgi:hypothetical protein
VPVELRGHRRGARNGRNQRDPAAQTSCGQGRKSTH